MTTSRLLRLALLLAAVPAAAGCATGRTTYLPSRAEPGELVLRYDDGFSIHAGQAGEVAHSPSYLGLSHFVRCVPDAHRHARAAESSGVGSMVLSGFSIGFALGGLGGLAGLAWKDRDDKVMAGFLVGGLALEVAAIALGGASLGARARAHGHALDSVAFYNDERGFSGGSCAAAP